MIMEINTGVRGVHAMQKYPADPVIKDAPAVQKHTPVSSSELQPPKKVVLVLKHSAPP
jgi:hypothetical protein